MLFHDQEAIADAFTRIDFFLDQMREIIYKVKLTHLMADIFQKFMAGEITEKEVYTSYLDLLKIKQTAKDETEFKEIMLQSPYSKILKGWLKFSQNIHEFIHVVARHEFELSKIKHELILRSEVIIIKNWYLASGDDYVDKLLQFKSYREETQGNIRELISRILPELELDYAPDGLGYKEINTDMLHEVLYISISAEFEQNDTSE